jgi:hypothetical protein
MLNPVHILLCVICDKRVSAEECKTDEHEHPVHELCYAEKLANKSTDLKERYDF